MGTRLQTQAKATPMPTPSFAPVRAGLLQRKRTLSGTPGPTGKFAASHGQRLVSQPPLIQPKLTINQPNDRYEQEADRVADLVMRMPEPRMQRQVEPEEEEEEETLQAKPLAAQITPLIQRQVEPEEEEEEPVQAKLADGAWVQRQEEEPEEEGEEEPVQAKQAGGQTPQASPGLGAQIRFLRGGGQLLSQSTRDFFEPRFGHDFSQVRIHTDTRAVELARALNAQAFTLGRNVVFGAGQYAPRTTKGKRLLAHELTHAVQQRQGNASAQVIQRALFLAYSNYRGRCECRENLGNNCAHYLSDALIRAGYGELDGGKGSLYRRRNGRIVCKSGRPVRAKELRDWFASKATNTLTNEPESDIPDGYWAVYQERARDGQGHVLLHKHSGSAYTWRGTGNYPRWRTQMHYSIPSAPGDWNLPRGETRLA